VTGLARVLALWRRRRSWLVLGAMVSLVSLASGVALATASGTVVAAALLGGALTAPLWLRVLGPVRVALRYAERLATHDATFRALADLRVWFFRGLAGRAANGLGYRHSGDVLARLVGDVEALDGLYLRILLPLLGAAVLLPALLIVLWRLGPGVATGVALLFVASAFAMPAWAARLAQGGGKRVAEAGAAMRMAAVDAVGGMREVRAYGLEGRMLAAVQAREAALFSAQHRQASGLAWAGAAALLGGQAALGLLLLNVEASAGAMAIGAVFLVSAAFEAVAGLPRAGWLAGQAEVAASRVIEAAEEPLGADADPAAPAALPAGSALRFEGVGFRWREDRPWVFDGLSLDVPQGGRVALLGPSGSGKSTLAALALRLASPQSGRVLLGGVDVATLAAADLRARVGMLNQATHLFSDTIRANLLLADPAADDAALWAALDAARVGDVVRALPDRLGAWVGEAGAGFSGGQGRRLALARALLSPASVLILDEPGAGLDADTEREFLGTLNEVAGTRTVILIAHRLIGVERLDRVWRLSGGHAVAAAA